MSFIKSTLVGIVTGTFSALATLVASMIIKIQQSRQQFPAGEIGLDLHNMLFHPSLVWVAAIVGFAVGFYWMKHRS